MVEGIFTVRLRGLFAFLTGAAVVVCCFSSTPAVAQQEVGSAEHADGIWARVNDEILTTLQVKRRLKDVTDEIHRTYKPEEAYRRVLEQINQYTRVWVETKLYLAEAKAQGLTITTKQVEDIFEKEIAEKYNGDLSVYEEILVRNGSSVAERKKEIEDRLMMNALKERVTSNKVFVMPKDMRKYYDAHKDEFRQEERIIARRIIFKQAKNVPDDRAALAQQMGPVEAAIQQGEDFGALAKKHSINPQEGRNGGKMEKPVSRGVELPEIDEALFSMEVGEVRSVVVDRGNELLGVILRVDEHLTEEIAPFDEVREALFQAIYQQKYKVVVDDFLAEMREKYVVFEGQP